MLEKQLPYKYKVYETIKSAIQRGEYQPGDVLNERRLSEELGISRTPIREGMQMLVQDGWLQTETYKGTVVRQLDPDYLYDLARIRKVLEVAAIEDAAANVTDKDIAVLSDILQQQEELLRNYETVAFMNFDRRFHAHLYHMSKNAELNRLLKNYYDMFLFLGTQAVLSTMERRYTTIREHENILEALRNRDAQACIGAMTVHMENTILGMEQYLHLHKN